ncbi:MAG TPA: hypothetical protein VKU41_28340, partial [Polyangiaceae bacterium]|nr:hypothetical protein [Polyangiaceae bacterium]
PVGTAPSAAPGPGTLNAADRIGDLTYGRLFTLTVSERIGLKKKFTPKGLRRTFNDAARVAALEGIVTMSISGHRTERMRDHYSTVNPSEQRDAVSKVLDLADAVIPGETIEASGMHCGMHEPQVVCMPRWSERTLRVSVRSASLFL